MPAYFQLFKKGSQEPSKFADIDVEICKYLGVEPDEKFYVHGWYDNIGAFIAAGKDWKGIREVWKDFPELLKVCDYLEANYNTSAWYSVR